MSPITRFKYSGTALPGNAELVVLFSTVVAFPAADFFNYCGIARFKANIEHTQAGTLNAYRSSDRGATWHQVSTEAIAIPAASEGTERDFIVEGCADWKLEWLNGATVQATFDVNMNATTDRGVAD